MSARSSRGCVTTLATEVVAAYNAAFPDECYRAGPRKFTVLGPSTLDGPAPAPNRQAWKVLKRWHKPSLTASATVTPSPVAENDS